MKMLYCACNIAILPDLVAIFDDMKLSNYQIIEPVAGKTVKGDPRMNTAVWPGFNANVMLQLDPETVSCAVAKIRDYNARALNDNEIIACCSWDIGDYVCE